MMKMPLLAAALALSATAGAAATLKAVDLELVLVQDVSDSINAADYNLIRQGYAAAFRSAPVITAIQQGKLGKIAVNVVQFKDVAKNVFDGAWFEIFDTASGEAFAKLLETMPRISGGGGTAVIAGMNLAVTNFGLNDFTAARQVIDFAIDGEENQECPNQSKVCKPLGDARDAAVAAGVDGINVLTINDDFLFGDLPLSQIPDNRKNNYVFATPYVKEWMLAGDNAFTTNVKEADEFAATIKAKLIQEITAPVPLPAAGWMLIAGLGGLAAMARRRKAAA